MGELGSLLVRAREAKGLTLEDAERDTRISRRYLQALETEQFDIIPAPVYARGFLRSYSQYLGLDPQEVLALFPREDQYPGARRSEARASPESPLPAHSPSRPTWRREPERADIRRPVPPPTRTPRQPFGAAPQRPAPPPREDYYEGPHDPYFEQQRQERYRQERQYQEDDYPEQRYQQPPRRFEDAWAYQQPERRQEPIRHDTLPLTEERYDNPRPMPPRARPYEEEPYDPSEPMIGVDIGVPAPTRRIRTDPAAQTRTLVVAIVAIAAVVGVILLALLIANLGSDDSPPPDTLGGDDEASAAVTNTPVPTETGSGGPVRGIVPDVVGLDIAVARAQVEAAGYVVNEVRGPNAAPVGEVFGQVPVGNTRHPEGETVTLAVSEGP